MSLLSILKKIALPAAAVAATPFTGGTSLLGMLGVSGKVATAIPGILSAVGSVAGGAANQRAADRGAQAEYGLLNDRNRLDYAQYNRQSQNDQMRQMLSADRLSSAHAPTDPRAQRFATGAAVSPQTIDLIRQRAMAPAAPMQVSAMPQAGKTDSILNALRMGGVVSKTLGEIGKSADAPSGESVGGIGDLTRLFPQQGTETLPDPLEMWKRTQATATDSNPSKFGRVMLPGGRLL